MAVTTIILFCQHFPELFKSDNQQQNLTGRIILWTRTGITVSFIALFATAPITLYHFHQVSLLGPLTTILTAPLICFWALPMGLTATLLSSFWPNLATTVLTIGGVGLRGADLLTSTLAAIPFTFHTLPPPPIITVTGYYLLAGYLLFCKSRRTGQVAALTTMILLINIPAHIFSPGRNNEEAIITFLDVGQGNSTLLELPGDKNILIDGGGSFSPIFDPGEQIIGPYLWHQSIRRLDALVISHAHHDHYNGLEFIIRNFKPKEVWVNGVREKSFGYRNILKAAAENGAKIRVPEQGTVLVFGGGAELTSISNMHLRNDPALPPNSRSLIIKLAMGGKSLILPGDMMAEDGRYLINQGVDLQSDILLAPHHGSKNSAGSLLVAKGPPKWLIVSASPFKADDFPAPDFAQWCIQQGINILNTATSGAIRFSLGKNGDIRQQIISEKSAKKQTGPG
jgi:competence protein ComEC